MHSFVEEIMLVSLTCVQLFEASTFQAKTLFYSVLGFYTISPSLLFVFYFAALPPQVLGTDEVFQMREDMAAIMRKYDQVCDTNTELK